jgi:hypothetical protein
MEIPDTSAESSLRCDASGKCSIPNALDFSFDEQPRSERCLFNRFGHTIRRTAQGQRYLSNERILSHLRRGVTCFAIPRDCMLRDSCDTHKGKAERDSRHVGIARFSQHATENFCMRTGEIVLICCASTCGCWSDERGASAGCRNDTERASGSSKLCVVGARGFEPPTPASRTQCATGLRYAPTKSTELQASGDCLTSEGRNASHERRPPRDR